MPTYYSQPSFYTITIDNVSGYPKSAPNNGFIDNNTVEDYANNTTINPDGLNLETGISGFTLAESEAKSRANVRYHNLLLQLNKECNIIVNEQYTNFNSPTSPGYVSEITYTGSPNYNVEPASISFMIMVERGDPSLQTWDELNPGNLLTGTTALTRFVVRALTLPPNATNDFSFKTQVYNPVATGQSNPYASEGTIETVPRNPEIVELLDVGPVVYGGSTATNYSNAAALVTITQPFTPPVQEGV